ncbi:hypothetical protein XELAEV_18022329mg [Xenopus laevis]|uniref:Uncharacterized protein n=1 Tax=Xenopus laevis TaxID=8355 RepID=A0A974D221_XENLA|nr:hypothetical protein XELAEV_18022329mg [Xenopus laevis]
MTTNMFRRAYSLRMPRSPKPASYVESSGLYDRLEETEHLEDLPDLKEKLGATETNFSWGIPLITDPPKLNYCRLKWSSKSLRLPKTRMAEADPIEDQTEVKETDRHNSSWQEPEDQSSCEEASDSLDSHTQREIQNDGEKQRSTKMKSYKKDNIDRHLVKTTYHN